MNRFIWEQPPQDPKWAECLNQLRTASTDAPPKSRFIPLGYMVDLMSKFPDSPPTSIHPTEDGILVERYEATSDRTCQILFRPDGSVERTDYVDGKVVRTTP